ncbi:MAG: rod shape-determining protein MreC [Acidimicrobiia bacterium]|nr:rod shape-determining protein MreC [Acidimicrobiia bacterium]
MLQPARSVRSRWILSLLVATSVSLLTLDFRGFGPLQTVQNGARGVAEPVVGAVVSATRPVRNAWSGIADYDRVSRENSELREELAELRAQDVSRDNAEHQLDEILAQQGIETASSIERVLSRVVAGPVANLDNTLRIDKGSDDGLRPDMAVVAGAGLVGRISSVTADRAVVELVDSRNFNIGVRLVGATAQTTYLARGQGPGRPLVLEGEVDPVPGLVDGGQLVTSGLDRSVFPPDIPVGRISGTGIAPGSPPPVTLPGTGEPRPLEEVQVSLLVDPRQLSFVTVLLWQPGD